MLPSRDDRILQRIICYRLGLRKKNEEERGGGGIKESDSHDDVAGANLRSPSVFLPVYNNIQNDC